MESTKDVADDRGGSRSNGRLDDPSGGGRRPVANCAVILAFPPQDCPLRCRWWTAETTGHPCRLELLPFPPKPSPQDARRAAPFSRRSLTVHVPSARSRLDLV